MKRLSTFAAALAIAFSAVACGQTDSGVTMKVKAKFAQDDIVKAHQIDVTTREGVVTLTGEVDTMAARQQAVRLARETEGVTNVVAELKVEAAATGGDVDDVDVDRDIEHGVHETGDAIRRGAEETADAAKKAGKAVRDAVTDNDRDSDRDGK
jgi:BON domain-containing protein